MTQERSFEAGQRFLLAAKGFWTTHMHARLRAEYEAQVKPDTPDGVASVAELVENLPLYQYFGWMERHLQSLKYSGRYGLAPYYRERRAAVLARLPATDDLVELDPAMPMPDYYRATDIHQHPGGVWSEDVAGFVYEHGARSTTPLLGQQHGDLHTRLTEKVVELADFRRVLDMGCGFGKSTLPFARALPKAQVEGVDLAAPCLRLAAQMAREAGLTNVRFRQCSATDTRAEDATYDLITSTMFLHELPTKVLTAVFEESFRVLQPGGRVVHLDFWKFPDTFARFLHYGHGRRNNEPYMQPLAELDLPAALRSKGFVDVQIESFKESPSADPLDLDVWRFPWTWISARKP